MASIGKVPPCYYCARHFLYYRNTRETPVTHTRTHHTHTHTPHTHTLMVCPFVQLNKQAVLCWGTAGRGAEEVGLNAIETNWHLLHICLWHLPTGCKYCLSYCFQTADRSLAARAVSVTIRNWGCKALEGRNLFDRSIVGDQACTQMCVATWWHRATARYLCRWLCTLDKLSVPSFN